MAGRNLTAGVLTALGVRTKYLAAATKFALDTGDINLWSGLGDITILGDTYSGVGDLLAFGRVEETAELEARGLETKVSGIPAGLLSMALSASYQGRRQKAWLVFLDADGAVISDPVIFFDGLIDTMQINFSGDTSEITVITEHVLVIMQRAIERRYQHEDQQLDFPGDLFFEFVAALQNKEVSWG